MRKAVFTAALTGSIHTPSMSPYLPITADQLIDEILAVHHAGGAVAHLHVRDQETGLPNADQDTYMEVASTVKKHCDIILCTTTGGRLGEPVEKRVRVAITLKPELASLNAGHDEKWKTMLTFPATPVCSGTQQKRASPATPTHARNFLTGY